MCHQSSSATCRSPTPKTPINRSLPEIFRRTKIQRAKTQRTGFRREKALLESSPEASRNFKNFNPKIGEHSKQNHLNYLPRSKSLRKSSSRCENINKSQISEAPRIHAPKNFHHKPLNTKNIRSRIIQTTCLDLKVHWNQAQKPPETPQTTNQWISTDSSL